MKNVKPDVRNIPGIGHFLVHMPDFPVFPPALPHGEAGGGDDLLLTYLATNPPYYP